MKKKYLAVVCGDIVHSVDNYVDYLLKDEKTNLSKIVDKGITGAKRAELSVYPLKKTEDETYGTLTLAEVELKTGRHHQIRVQMAGHGFPLWGDNKYNPAFNGSNEISAGTGAGRIRADVALASCHLTFAHPASGKRLTFEEFPDAWIFRRFQPIGK